MDPTGLASLMLGLVAALSWGVHDVLVRYVSVRIGVLLSLAIVLAAGCVFQAITTIAAWAPVPDARTLWLSVAAGVVFFPACVAHYRAFERGPVRAVAPMIGSYSVLAFLWAAWTGATIDPLQWVAVIALLMGLALVTRRGVGQPVDEAPPLGPTILWCAAAATGFAATFAIGQEAAEGHAPWLPGLVTRATATALALATLAFVIMRERSTLAGGRSTPSRERSSLPRGRSLGILVAMGGLDAVALGAVLAAGNFARPEFASAGSSIFGLLTVVLAWLWLGERMRRVQWTGVAVTFSAIAYLAAS